MRNFVFLLMVALAPAVAVAATPSEGVPLTVRRGFFTETDVGGFFTLGGNPGYSNLQTYLQLGVGYQFTLNEGKGLLPVSLTVGIGANSQNCFAQVNRAGACVESTSSSTAVSDSFTLTFFSASAGYLARVVDRFYVGGKVVAGLTLLDPTPFALQNMASVNLGPNVGVAGSIEYATNMDHFSVGLDVGFRVVIGPSVISALMFYPRVQYTF